MKAEITLKEYTEWLAKFFTKSELDFDLDHVEEHDGRVYGFDKGGCLIFGMGKETYEKICQQPS